MFLDATPTPISASPSPTVYIGGILVYWIVYYLPLYGVLTKAGRPGWAAFVPIYNWILYIETARRPAWWVILLLIPIVNVVVFLIVAIDAARAFGHGIGMGLVLFFFSWIGWLILWLGGSTYRGAGAGRAPAPI